MVEISVWKRIKRFSHSRAITHIRVDVPHANVHHHNRKTINQILFLFSYNFKTLHNEDDEDDDFDYTTAVATMFTSTSATIVSFSRTCRTTMAQMDAFLTSHNRHHQDHCCATILSTPYAMHTVHEHSITRTYMKYRECREAGVGGVCACVCINRHKVTSMQSAMDFDAGFRILACVSSFKSRTFKLTTLFSSQTESVRE